MITHGLPHWLQKELDVLYTLSDECEAEALAMYLGTFKFNPLLNGQITIETDSLLRRPGK